jgi:hypothetical protein
VTDPETMLNWMDRRIWSLHTYLEDHGPGSKSPRPETVLDAKREDIRMFEELRGAYVKALARRNGEAA